MSGVARYRLTRKPEKDLLEEHHYIYHPDKDMQKEILDGVLEINKTAIDFEKDTVDIQINIIIKKYKTEPEMPKQFWYSKINDPKNTGI